VIFALMLVTLLGLVGLVIDGGFLLSRHRQVQNAADAAALSYAMEKLVGQTDETALAAANAIVQNNPTSGDPPGNGFLNAQTLASGQNVFVPPQDGPHRNPTGPRPHDGKLLYVEVVLTVPMQTWFIHILGLNQTRQVRARAVATWGELLTAGEGAIVLDPRQKESPGFNVSGGGTIRVRGGIFNNNEGDGEDENNNPVDGNGDGDTNDKPAASGGQPNDPNGGIYTTSFRVVGGVDNSTLFKNIDTGTNEPNILHTGVLPIPDPLVSLATPYVGNGVLSPATDNFGNSNSANNNDWGHVSVNNNTANVPFEDWKIDIDTDGNYDYVQLWPGSYKSLSITGGTVIFIPGIYVISAGKVKALKITGGVITARGVMFYNTGANYDPTTGEPDASDPYDPAGTSPPPSQSNTQFGDVMLNSGTEMLPIDTTNPEYTQWGTYPPGIDVFDGMLFYQRRMNPFAVEIQGESSGSTLAGTIYAKWARFKISGNGVYDAQFIVGSMTITGNGDITFTYAGQGRGKAPAVFLVE
jgi:hypothetical protein